MTPMDCDLSSQRVLEHAAKPGGRASDSLRPTVGASSNDGELALALSARAPEAPRVAWERYRPLVHGILRRALGADSEIEDVAQDVFLRVFASVHRLREPSALRAFVITVTKRTLGHEARRRRARPALLLDQGGQPTTMVGLARDGTAHLAFNHLRRLLERMNERERNAFVLRFVDRMEAKELAETLGVSEPTARRAYSKAWKRTLTWALRHPFLSEYVESWDVAMRPPIARGGAAAVTTSKRAAARGVKKVSEWGCDQPMASQY